MNIEFRVNTKEKKQVVDLTQEVNQMIAKHQVESGWGKVFALHTTCCLTTADLDPGTDKDYLKAIETMFPQGDYQHPHDPEHVGDHIMSSIIGPSVEFPVKNGQAHLGSWQKIVLIELNGPRERSLVLKIRTD